MAGDGRDSRVDGAQHGPEAFQGVHRQLTIRECCGGAKGLRYADLPAVEDDA